MLDLKDVHTSLEDEAPTHNQGHPIKRQKPWAGIAPLNKHGESKRFLCVITEKTIDVRPLEGPIKTDKDSIVIVKDETGRVSVSAYGAPFLEVSRCSEQKWAYRNKRNHG